MNNVRIILIEHVFQVPVSAVVSDISGRRLRSKMRCTPSAFQQCNDLFCDLSREITSRETRLSERI
jgi:hypothetical protein